MDDGPVTFLESTATGTLRRGDVASLGIRPDVNVHIYNCCYKWECFSESIIVWNCSR